MAKAAQKKVRLYKIAAELNVGKEEIASFLQSQGFEIEPKATAVLTPEMVEKVYERFRSEYEKAQKIREKSEEVTADGEKLQELVEEEKKKREVEQTTQRPVEAEEPVTETTEPERVETTVLKPKILGMVDVPIEKKEEKQKKRGKGRQKRKPELEKESTSKSVERQGEQEVAVKDFLTSPEVERKEEPVPDETVISEEAGEEREEVDTTGEVEFEDTVVERASRKKEKDRRKHYDDEGEEEGGQKRRFRRRKKTKHVEEEEVAKAVQKTLQEIAVGEVGLEERRRLRKKRKQQRKEEMLQQMEEMKRLEKIIEIPEFITVGELANALGVTPNQLIKKCLDLGMIVSINQRLDKDVITLIAEDLGFEVRFAEEADSEVLIEDEGQPEEYQPRPPVVTIMGHVDHGKTSLLDYIRQSNIVAGEAGGITQHIGAYKVALPDDPSKSITFLDTPGHEAFTAMRARGAQVTDIVVLVVAADDRVMPQTEEAISHARAANVPIVVAINKIDKPEANPDLIKQQLAELGLLVEEWGGDVPCVEVSAKTGQGVDQLLETILLVAELQELKANPKRRAVGTVIESKLDRGKGPVATVLVQNGTLHEGDVFVCGATWGRVRAMLDERSQRVQEAGPSTPVQVLGFDEVPEAGDQLVVVESEAQAREIARKRQILKREKLMRRSQQTGLEQLASLIKDRAVKELPIVLKADVMGSLEALSEALYKLSTDEVKVSVIHKGIGAISESDVMLAAAANAVVIGFHVRPTSAAKLAAEREGVEIRIYRVIYDCINEIRQVLEGMLQPVQREEVVGVAEVREIFRIRKIGTIAGCYVREGTIHRNDRVRVIRDGIEIFEGSIRSLRRFKEDVREVRAGYECGILIDGFNDVRVGDEIEAVQIKEEKRTLESVSS